MAPPLMLVCYEQEALPVFFTDILYIALYFVTCIYIIYINYSINRCALRLTMFYGTLVEYRLGPPLRNFVFAGIGPSSSFE